MSRILEDLVVRNIRGDQSQDRQGTRPHRAAFAARARRRGDRMKRREFIALLSGAGAGWPFRVLAQQRAMLVIGVMSGRSEDSASAILTAFGIRSLPFEQSQVFQLTVFISSLVDCRIN
jgi:hypothetical protein